MLNLIPRPRYAKELEGTVSFSQNTKLIGAFCENFDVLKNMLPNGAAPENTLTFVEDTSVAAEGYRILCENGDITVYASDASGAFYAVMTLLQLAGENTSIPAVEIEDKPRYEHRGFMLDCSRHFWTVEKIKSIIDFLARLKMNIFHWHLTEDQGWRIEIKKYPLLTTKGTIRKSTPLNSWGYEDGTELHDDIEYGRGMFYTQEQVKDVVKYAAERRINIIPEVDMPGHFVAAIACYPELSCTGEEVEVSDRWGVRDIIGCCGKENIYNFVKDVIDELCELFPYPYFHIGGDEVPKDRWKVCPHCQAKIKELGLKDENALQSYFNNVISAYLKGKGKSTIGWNEILEGENLDSSIIPQWWIEMDESVREKKWLADGNKMILSPIHFAYIPRTYVFGTLEKTYSSGPSVCGIEDCEGIRGIEACQWTEFTLDERNLNTFADLRLIAISEACWLPESEKNYKCFEKRLENLRPYWKQLGAHIVSQKIYRGNYRPDMDVTKLSEEQYWEIIKKNPLFDYEYLLEIGEA